MDEKVKVLLLTIGSTRVCDTTATEYCHHDCDCQATAETRQRQEYNQLCTCVCVQAVQLGARRWSCTRAGARQAQGAPAEVRGARALITFTWMLYIHQCGKGASMPA
jgi:hypothetical protein